MNNNLGRGIPPLENISKLHRILDSLGPQLTQESIGTRIDNAMGMQRALQSLGPNIGYINSAHKALNDLGASALDIGAVRNIIAQSEPLFSHWDRVEPIISNLPDYLRKGAVQESLLNLSDNIKEHRGVISQISASMGAAVKENLESELSQSAIGTLATTASTGLQYAYRAIDILGDILEQDDPGLSEIAEEAARIQELGFAVEPDDISPVLSQVQDIAVPIERNIKNLKFQDDPFKQYLLTTIIALMGLCVAILGFLVPIISAKATALETARIAEAEERQANALERIADSLDNNNDKETDAELLQFQLDGYVDKYNAIEECGCSLSELIDEMSGEVEED